MIFADMKRRVIYIYHENGAYLRRMAGRLALLMRGAEVHAAAPEDLDDPSKEVYIMERYASAESTAAEISQIFGLGKAGNAESCLVTGFTSGCGVCVAISVAVMYWLMLSQFYELKVLYLSLDRMAVKCSPFRNNGREEVFALLSGRKTAEQLESSFGRGSSGLYYMVQDEEINPCSYLDEAELAKLLASLSGSFDRIVLDIPLNASVAFSALELCDRIVVCFGWQEELYGASECLMDILGRMREGVLKFAAAYDEDRGRDLFGQFGAEVRQLAQSIEGKQDISS